MDVIQGHCPTCGDVILDPSETSLEAAASAGRFQLKFRCPRCARPFRSTVDREMARALQRAGVPTSAEDAGHPEHPRPGPALVLDDLLDLHLTLETDGWFEDLVALVRDSENA